MALSSHGTCFFETSRTGQAVWTFGIFGVAAILTPHHSLHFGQQRSQGPDSCRFARTTIAEDQNAANTGVDSRQHDG
jgi:hypothetical protein